MNAMAIYRRAMAASAAAGMGRGHGVVGVGRRRWFAAAADDEERIVIIGGGIAGLSTARFLLGGGRRITLIDRNVDALPSNGNDSSSSSSCDASSYERRLVEGRPHMNIPSRRNGNVLCPSLTVPWTTRSLWKEAILPGLKSAVGYGGGGVAPSVTFDWASLATNRNMVRGVWLSIAPWGRCTILHVV